jgi:hypothetical protein
MVLRQTTNNWLAPWHRSPKHWEIINGKPDLLLVTHRDY